MKRRVNLTLCALAGGVWVARGVEASAIGWLSLMCYAIAAVMFWIGAGCLKEAKR